MKTVARRDGSEWVPDGEKTWLTTNGPFVDVALGPGEDGLPQPGPPRHRLGVTGAYAACFESARDHAKDRVQFG